MNLKTATFVFVLFVFSFVVRATAVLALRDIQTGPSGCCSADDVEFNKLALHVSRGEGYVGDEGYPTSFRARVGRCFWRDCTGWLDPVCRWFMA